MSRGSVRLAGALTLDCGRTLDRVEIRYETWGTLSPERDNAVLVCHSLTKTGHAARHDPADPPGWWERAIGPGRMIDTDRWFVIGTDTLAAGGSTGPASVEPATGRPYGSRFPVVTVRDMVRAQRAALREQWGIERLHAVAGGCFGGQQVLEWAIGYPDAVDRALAIAVTPSTSAHSIAIFAVQRHLIRSDPAFNGGDYYGGPPPAEGLSRAVAAAMPLWMSRAAMEAKYGRRRAEGAPAYSLEPEFAVEAFIEALARRRQPGIDPNGLMHLTRAVEYFDLAGSYGSVAAAGARIRARTLLVSYRGDWRYPSAEMEELGATIAGSRHLVLDNPLGHGAFLFDLTGLEPAVTELLAGVAVR
jgi:homoserine O-acetyltransferase